MSSVWKSFPNGGSELLALLALADFADDDGRNIHPSITTLAKKLRLSRSQTQRVVHALLDAGWIRIVGNTNGGAAGATRRYEIDIGRLTGSTGATGRVNDTGSTHARQGSHGCAEGVAPMRPNSSVTISDPSSSYQGETTVLATSITRASEPNDDNPFDEPDDLPPVSKKLNGSRGLDTAKMAAGRMAYLAATRGE